MSFARVIAEAKPAHTKAPIKGARAATKRTAIIFAHLELIGSFRFNPKTLLSQWKSPPSKSPSTGKRNAHQLEQTPAFVVRFRSGDERDGHPARFVDFVGLNFGKNNLFAQSQRIVASTVE